MNFFELSAPEYLTDKEGKKYNPIEVRSDYFIPSVQCDVCGVWASSDRIRINFERSALKPFKGINFLDLQSWKEARKDWSSMLQVPENIITPGAELGEPKVKLLSLELNDFMHPMPGQVIVSSKVANILQDNHISGVELFPLTPVWSKKIKEEKDEIPNLWELVITGTGWRKGVDEKAILACNLCDRTVFPTAPMILDKNKWDGSDIFTIDHNPNRIFITERFSNLMKSSELTNYQLSPIISG